MTTFSPREIVSELDRFIIGQNEAKRAVAVALRNRWRRKQLADDIREEVYPKNILMIGPTGVGKTEISRRLARLAKAPFLKVEATKFTEVGYVGRDVEQIARDLVEEAVRLERERRREKVRSASESAAMDRLLDALTGKGVRLALQSLMLGLGALLAVDGQITAGMMIAGSILAGRVLAPLDQLINAWKQWSGAQQAYQRLCDLLRAQPPRASGMSLPAPRGVLRVEQLSACAPGSRSQRG